MYSSRWLKAHRVNAVVFSIGNITTGGTGKTPLVIWMYKQILQNEKFKTKNLAMAILTRGYKSHLCRQSQIADEPAILAESCPCAKVIVSPDRVAGARDAVDKFAAQILIMDDGFQHRRLARNLDIVAIDAANPFGFGKMLPAGLLREPVNALKRANAVVITHCDMVSGSDLAIVENKILTVRPDMTIAKSIHSPVCVKSGDNKQISLHELKDKKVFVSCGIGSPSSFLSTIKGLNVNIVGAKIYDDHHKYTAGDVAEIDRKAGLCGAELILLTQKDWNKTIAFGRANESIAMMYLEIEIKFVTGEDKLKRLIDKVIAVKMA